MKSIMVIIVLLMVFSVAKLGQYVLTPPSCSGEAAMNGLIVALKDTDLGAFAINDVLTQSNGLISHARECTGQVATLRGGQDATDMKWFGVRYTVKASNDSEVATVDAKLGDRMTLAGETNWEQFVQFMLY